MLITFFNQLFAFHRPQSSPPTINKALLSESGKNLLLEDGSKMLLEKNSG